jgi:hypothetical protein
MVKVRSTKTLASYSYSISIKGKKCNFVILYQSPAINLEIYQVCTFCIKSVAVNIMQIYKTYKSLPELEKAKAGDMDNNRVDIAQIIL